MRKHAGLILLRLTVVLLLGAAGCYAPQSHSRSGEHQAIADSLYFGSVKPDGVVTEEEWQSFVLKEITPRFPGGLTSWQASGQWLSASGTLQRERSFILYLVHPDSVKDERAIQEIIASYKKFFHQESVLRVRNLVWVSF